MKTFKDWLVIPTALAMLLTSAGAALTQTTQIAPGFQPDPLVIRGTSGGSQNKGCGMTGATPNLEISLSANFNYLRFTVQSTGQPTLLIEGPTGSSCVQADSFSKGIIQAPGYWEKGTYLIYIGDRAGAQNPAGAQNRTGAQNAYTLSITQKR